MRAGRLPVTMALLQDLLNLPQGATIIDVRKGDYETVEFLVIDESFPMLPEHAEVPFVQLALSRVESRWLHDDAESVERTRRTLVEMAYDGDAE